MTASYTAVATPKDAVRLEVGDTDVPANAMLQDEEIAHYLALEADNVLRAAARSAAAIAGRFARLVDTSVLNVRVAAQQQYEHYRQLAAELADRAVTDGGTAAPFLGGIGVSDVRTRTEDADRVDPFFTRQTGDNPPVLDRDDPLWWWR